MKIDILFNLYKDTLKTSNDEKRKALKKRFPDIDITELHRRIVNYQVEKYGGSLNDYCENMTYKEYSNAMRNRKDRKRQRLYGKVKRKI